MPDQIDGSLELVRKLSPWTVEETVERLTRTAEAKGAKVFAVIDHSGEAAANGLPLRNTKVVIFGSPLAGTPVMAAVPLVALDLPLKVLIFADGDQTTVVYAPPSELARRYGLSDELAANLRAIDLLTDAAVAAA